MGTAVDIFKRLRNISIDYSSLGRDVDKIEIMGKQMTTEDIARLAGAMSGSTVKVKYEKLHFVKDNQIREVFSLVFEVHNPKYLDGPMVRHIFDSDVNGVMTIVDNINFVLKEAFRGKKIAAQSLAFQVEAAQRLGFTKIVANVAGAPDSAYTGWMTWPQMGYDGTIPNDILSSIPEDDLAAIGLLDIQSLTIQRLLDAGGEELWIKYGKGFNMEIDLLHPNQRAKNLVEQFVKNELEMEKTL